jgi:hypothetical protein
MEGDEDIPVGPNEIRRCGVAFLERPGTDIVLIVDNCDLVTGGEGSVS